MQAPTFQRRVSIALRGSPLCLAAMVLASCTTPEVSSAPLRWSHTTKAKMLNWLVESQVDQEAATDPTKRKYPDDPGRPGLLRDRLTDLPNPDNPEDIWPDFDSWPDSSDLYNNALALVALSGGPRPWSPFADQLADALSTLTPPDGNIDANYNPVYTAGDSSDPGDGASGRKAWVAYALTYYYRNVRRDDAALAAAERIADHLLNHRTLSTGRLDGAIMFKHVGLAISGFRPVSFHTSTEHQIESYFLFRDLAVIHGSASFKGMKYRAQANKLKTLLLTTYWNDTHKHFNQGTTAIGDPDPFLAVDANAWGTLFLMSLHESDRAVEALPDTISDRVNGCLAALEDLKISKDCVHPASVPISLTDLYRENVHSGFIWLEGSLQIALAYWRTGNRARAEEIVDQVLRMRAPKGIASPISGIPNAACLPGSSRRHPSVETTSWAIIFECLRDDDSFWGETPHPEPTVILPWRSNNKGQRHGF